LTNLPPEPSEVASANVSVVVPSYNHAQFVERCLRSIFKQTLPPAELIVIDDGSNDGSSRIIEQVLKTCPCPHQFIARGNRGLTVTLNEGISHCVPQKYFAYLGSDDLWMPDFLAARVQLLESRPRAMLAYGNAYSIDADDAIIDCTIDWARYVDGDVRAMLLTTLAPLSPTVVYRRDALPEKPWNEASKLEDYELYLRLSAEGEFAFDPRVLSAWRQHDSNVSQRLQLMLDERLAAQQRVAPELGLSQMELGRFQSLACFRSAQEFMRQGHKLTSLQLFLTNLRGVPSVPDAARLAAGLVIPRRFLRQRKQRLSQRARARYGSLTNN
jgi:alpha-1,3-rhamnosyltransferase